MLEVWFKSDLGVMSATRDDAEVCGWDVVVSECFDVLIMIDDMCGWV